MYSFHREGEQVDRHFVVSIRAYSAQNSFRQESLRRIDKVTLSSRTFYNLNRWISIRVDVVGAFFSSALAIYSVYGTGAAWVRRGRWSLVEHGRWIQHHDLVVGQMPERVRS